VTDADNWTLRRVINALDFQAASEPDRERAGYLRELAHEAREMWRRMDRESRT
jgi:hypothetical protein